MHFNFSLLNVMMKKKPKQTYKNPQHPQMNYSTHVSCALAQEEPVNEKNCDTDYLAVYLQEYLIGRQQKETCKADVIDKINRDLALVFNPE